MTESSLRQLLGNADIAATDLVTGIAQIEALAKLASSRLSLSDKSVLAAGLKNLEAARAGLRSHRDALQSHVELESIFTADHAGEDAKLTLRSLDYSRAPGSGE